MFPCPSIPYRGSREVDIDSDSCRIQGCLQEVTASALLQVRTDVTAASAEVYIFIVNRVTATAFNLQSFLDENARKSSTLKL